MLDSLRPGTRPLLAALLILIALCGAPARRPAHAQEVEPAAAGQAALSDALAARLAHGESASFLVVLADQPQPAQMVAAAGVDSTPTQARTAVLYRELTAHAAATQAPLRAWLDAQGVPYRPYYIVNMIEVTGDAALAEALLARPDVARLVANLPVQGVLGSRVYAYLARLPRSWAAGPPVATPVEMPWGLPATGAPEVWVMGITGQGIVIGNADTGVDWTHPALQAHYRGWDATNGTADHAYNWFDAFGADATRAGVCPDDAATDPQIPCDVNGHGTHTVGTLLGDATHDPAAQSVIGMAPGAEWIGCRNMTTSAFPVGTPASYAACFEFFLAPYPQGGDPATDGRPELAPHIISNSWGCPPEEGCDEPDMLRQVVETARAAGQFVVASAGNKGPSCSSVVDPIGIYDASFTVGATVPSGDLAVFSSRGPVTIDGSNRVKPDLTAPGQGILSSMPGGSYGFNSGTSMAAPHVAGAVALLWSADPSLVGDIERTEEILRLSAEPVPSDECTPGGAQVPNAAYGHGRLDAAAAVAYVGPPALRLFFPFAAHTLSE